MELNIPVQVTDRAFARLAEIAEDSGEEKALRVAVLGGGCSGFSYEFVLEDAPRRWGSRDRTGWSQDPG